MEIVIKGTAKEIADLVLVVQGRQSGTMELGELASTMGSCGIVSDC